MGGVLRRNFLGDCGGGCYTVTASNLLPARFHPTHKWCGISHSPLFKWPRDPARYPMSSKKRFGLRRRRGLSRVITEVIIIVIVLGACALAGLYFTGTLSSLIGGSNPVLMVEAASSSVNLGNGSGTIYLTLKNSGSGTLQLSSLTIDGKTNITITGVGGIPRLAWGTGDHHINGTFTASSPLAGVSGNSILIPSGQVTTLKFTFDGSTNKLTDVLDIGVNYSGVAFPLSGNPIQFRFLLPSW